MGCGLKQETSAFSHPELEMDTVANNEFCYLPDTCIMDRGLFSFTSNLAKMGNIYYSDSITDGKKYCAWYKETKSLFLSNFSRRNIGIDFCLNYISMNVIPKIKEYGYNCTAANGEAAWLNWCLLIYKMFSVQENILLISDAYYSHLWKKEMEAWLKFMAKLFPLIEYDICDYTGSGAAYDVPITLSKIVQNRIDDLTKSVNKFGRLDADSEESLNRLEFSIRSIHTFRFDWDKNEIVEDIFQHTNKTAAIETLHQWIAIRSNIARQNGNKSYFNGTKVNLMDSISATIYHIRH